MKAGRNNSGAERDSRGDLGPKHRRSKEWIKLIASKSRPGARIRLATHRCFILSDGQPILIRQVLERAYPRLKRFTAWHYLAARRALRQEPAVVIARNIRGRGRPGLWAKPV
jgi:hypothetical protein